MEDVDWIGIAEHASRQPMRAPTSRAETAVVPVIVRLTGHLHVDDARDFADAAGKPASS